MGSVAEGSGTRRKAVAGGSEAPPLSELRSRSEPNPSRCIIGIVPHPDNIIYMKLEIYCIEWLSLK